MEARLKKTEDGFANLCQAFAAVNRKIARLRDKGDTLAAALLSFAHVEHVQKSTQTALKSASEAVALIQDYRHASVTRSDLRVVDPLSRYGAVCQKTHRCFRDFALAWKEQEDVSRRLEARRSNTSPGDGSLHSFEMSQMERALQQRALQTAQRHNSLHEQILVFERKKTEDLKNALLEFVQIEIAFHAKALEVLSKASRHVDAMDPKSDMVEFHSTLHPSVHPGVFASVAVSTPWNTPVATWGPQALAPYTGGDVAEDANGGAGLNSSNSFYMGRSTV